VDSNKIIDQLQSELNEAKTRISKLEAKNDDCEFLGKLFLNAVDDIVFLKNEDFVHIMVNQGYCKFLGKGEKEIIGKTDFEILSHEVAENCRESDNNAFKSDGIFSIEERIGDKTYSVRKFKVEYEEGKYGIGGYISDITARVENEEKLNIYRRIFENSNDGIGIVSSDLIFREQNQAHKDLLGYSDQELIEMSSNLHQNEMMFKVMMEEIEENGYSKKEIKTQKKSGELLNLDISSFIVKDSDGKIDSIIGIKRDITERKRAEKAVKASEERFRLLIENAPVGIIISDIDGNIILVNSATVEMLGSPSTYETEKINLLTFPPLAEIGYAEDFKECIKGNTIVSAEREYVSKWQENIFVNYYIAPINDSENNVVGIQTIIENRTSQKKVEDKLRDSEKRYRGLADATFEAVFISENGYCIDANRTACEMFGYEYKELIGIYGTDVIASEYKDLVRKNILEDYEEPYEVVAMRKDGTQFHVEINAKMTKQNEKNIRTTVVRNVDKYKKTLAALKKSEERLALAILSANDGMWDWKVADDIVYFDRNYFTMLGYEPNEFKHSYEEWRSRVHPDDITIAERAIQLHAEGKHDHYSVEFRMLHKNGEWFWILSRGKAVEFAEDGSVIRMIGTHSDINDRKNAENELKELKDLHESIVNNMADGIIAESPDGIIQYVNPAMEKMLEYDQGELIGEHWKVLNAKDQYEVIASANSRRNKGISDSYEIELLKKDGTRKSFLVSGSPNYKDGEYSGLLAVFKDITDRKILEKELQQDRKRLLEAQRIGKIGSYEIDLKTMMVYPSQGASEIYGLNPALKEINFSEIASIYPYPEDEKIVQEAHQNLLATGKSDPIEYRIITSDGMIKNIISHRELLLDESSVPQKIIGTIQDITNKKISENELIENELKLRTIFNNSFDAVGVSKYGKHVMANPNYEKLFGYTDEELSDQSILDLIAKDSRSQVMDNIEKRKNGEAAPSEYETRGLKKDGSTFDMQVKVSTYKIDNETYTLAVLRDITKQRKLEEEKKKDKELLEEAQRIGKLGSYEFDIDKKTIKPSTGARRIFAIEEQVEEHLLVEVLDRIHPDDVDDFIDRLKDTIETGDTTPYEYRIIALDGIVKYLLAVRELVYDSQGKAIKILGMVQDITEQKMVEVERKKLDQRFQEAQKKESLSLLAGGIAHDFNNLLTGILGNASLALMDMSELSPERKSLIEIEKSAKLAADLTKQMLAYSGKGQFVVEDFDLSELIKEMTHLMKSSISKKSYLDLKLGGLLPAMNGDITQIRQLLMNLIINASESLEGDEGILTVGTGYKELNENDISELLINENIEPGEYVFISVADNGIGINPNSIKKIFDPFYTTKFVGRGLGLAATQGIISGHNGALKVSSIEKKGSTFTVYFPASAPHIKNSKVEYFNGKISKGSGTILIADDEPAVLSLAKRSLERAGYEILTARDGIECIEVYKIHQTEISLVLLDLSMPRMDGNEVHKELIKINPNIITVLTSGYSELEARKLFEGKGLDAFINKPFRPLVLIDTINRILDQ
jgi:PAS domain S-box-containing protein